MNLSECNEINLLRLYSEIIDELESRGVVKTRNQPIAGYSRWFTPKEVEKIANWVKYLN